MNHRVYAARRVVLVLGRLGFLSLIASRAGSYDRGRGIHGRSRHSDTRSSATDCHTEPDRNTHPGRRCQSKAHTTPVSDQSARSSGAD